MEIKTLELKGFVHEYSEDVYLEEKKDTTEDAEDYYYPEVQSVGSIISTHFRELSKPVTVSYRDWTHENYLAYKDVFARYFVSDKETTWDAANEESIRTMAGAIETEDRHDGYSEYTVTDSWTDLFVGGHDLREEIKTHKGKFVILRIDYKV